MAFEINPRHADLALEWFRDLVQESRSLGTKFTLGTDAILSLLFRIARPAWKNMP